jgi:hypothetical protein
MPLPVDAAELLPLPVFAFGAQLEEEFVAQLLEHSVNSRPARLTGYRAARLANVDWSVLIAEEGATVDGRIICGLLADDLERIDAYEGVGEGLYRRTEVTVTAGEAGAEGPRQAFIYLPTQRTLSRCGLR